MSEANARALPPGWIAPKLSEVARINPPLDRCIVGEDTEVAFAPMRAVEAGGAGLTSPESRRYGDVKKGYTAFLSRDVIMAKITPCMENGKTAVVPDVPEGVCFGSTEFHVVRPEGGVLASWIAHHLLRRDTRGAAQRAMTGAVGQMRVPASFLAALRLPLPPLREQIRIVEVVDELLSDIDAGVASLEQARAKLKAYRASVLKAAVDGTLTAEWRAEHPHVEPASALLDRILAERRRRWDEEQLARRDTNGERASKSWRAKYVEPAAPPAAELADLPAGWQWASLDQLLWRLRSGTAETSSRNVTDYPVLRSSAVRQAAINWADINYLQPAQSGNADNYVRRGDLLITRLSGSVEYVGCAAHVKALPTEAVQYPDRIFCGKLVEGIDGTYLTYCLQHPRARQLLEVAARSTAGHQRISISDLVGLSIAVPPRPEQDAIVEIVEEQLSVVDHLEADLDAKLRAAQALRQSVLRHAFTGQLVPQDPSDEPAAALLARIAAERGARTADEAKGRPRPRGRSRQPA